jgi:hypothetical protein
MAFGANALILPSRQHLIMRSARRPATETRREVENLLLDLNERRRKTEIDRGIGREIHRVFEADGPKVEGLHFYVFQGGVSIYGAVATFAQRDAVMAALSTIPGITQIADHLTVLS